MPHDSTSKFKHHKCFRFSPLEDKIWPYHMSWHWPLLLRLLTTSAPVLPPVLVHLKIRRSEKRLETPDFFPHLSHLYNLSPFTILSSGATNINIMSLADVLDVLQGLRILRLILLKEKIMWRQPTGPVNYLWDRCIGANAMLVHQLNQLALLERNAS